MGEKLTDIEIIHGQKMLKQQFPKLNGLRSTLQQDKPSNEPTTNWIQIVHYHGGVNKTVYTNSRILAFVHMTSTHDL